MGQQVPEVIGRLSMRAVVEALMAERDHPGAELMQQLLDVGLVEPDDPALGPGGVKERAAQGREVDLTVHEDIKHVAQVAPFADAPSQCPLGPTTRAHVVLVDARARAAQLCSVVAGAREEALVLATRTASAAPHGF